MRCPVSVPMQRLLQGAARIGAAAVNLDDASRDLAAAPADFADFVNVTQTIRHQVLLLARHLEIRVARLAAEEASNG